MVPQKSGQVVKFQLSQSRIFFVMLSWSLNFLSKVKKELNSQLAEILALPTLKVFNYNSPPLIVLKNETCSLKLKNKIICQMNVVK